MNTAQLRKSQRARCIWAISEQVVLASESPSWPCSAPQDTHLESQVLSQNFPKAHHHLCYTVTAKGGCSNEADLASQGKVGNRITPFHQIACARVSSHFSRVRLFTTLWTEEAGSPQSTRLQRFGHNWATNMHTHTCTNTKTKLF